MRGYFVICKWKRQWLLLEILYIYARTQHKHMQWNSNAATSGLLIFVGAAVVISGIVLLARPEGESSAAVPARPAVGAATGLAHAAAATPCFSTWRGVTWVKFKQASGACVGYPTRVFAQQACYTAGLALCTKDELAAQAYSNCETGWTAEAKGWWRASAASGCGTAGWNGNNADDGLFGAYCCGTARGAPASFVAGGFAAKKDAEAACKSRVNFPRGARSLCSKAQLVTNQFSGCTIGWAKDAVGWWRDRAASGCGTAGWNGADAADAAGAFCCNPCPAGYHEDGLCVPNVCSCNHGTPVTGPACTSHGAEHCASCKDGGDIYSFHADTNTCSCDRWELCNLKALFGPEAWGG